VPREAGRDTQSAVPDQFSIYASATDGEMIFLHWGEAPTHPSPPASAVAHPAAEVLLSNERVQALAFIPPSNMGA
jgi:hypothetical protein